MPVVVVTAGWFDFGPGSIVCTKTLLQAQEKRANYDHL